MTAGTGASRRRAIAAAALLALAGLLALLATPRDGSRADAAAATASAQKVIIASKTFRMMNPNNGKRFVVLCPKGRYPLGGGMKSNPVPDQTGEGIYPHSYERLGVQAGFHISAILHDPSPGQTTPRDITLQSACGPKLGKITPPHKTVQLEPGQSARLVMTCPGQRYLVGGGFQRTNWTNFGGSIATESRALTAKKWVVSGRATGKFGGELTGIAYCIRSKKPLIRTVSAKTTIEPRSYATAKTPACPKGRDLSWGGFASPASGDILMTNGGFRNKGNTWATGGYNKGPAAPLTAFGYCLNLKPFPLD